MRNVAGLLALATGIAAFAVLTGDTRHAAAAFIAVWLLLAFCGSMLAGFAWSAAASGQSLQAFGVVIGWAGLYGTGGAWSGPVLQDLVGLERLAGAMRDVGVFEVPASFAPLGDIEALLFLGLGSMFGLLLFLSHAWHALVLGPSTRDQV